MAVGPKSDDRERTRRGSPYTIHRFAREVIAAITHQRYKHTNYRVINVTTRLRLSNTPFTTTTASCADHQRDRRHFLKKKVHHTAAHERVSLWSPRQCAECRGLTV